MKLSPCGTGRPRRVSKLQRPLPRACKTAFDVTVGEQVKVSYVISDSDILKFAEISGDYNPVHFDNSFASKTLFGRKIAHGIISIAKFSGIFGMDLPGMGALWESQEVRFLGPVFVGVQYTAVAEVTEVRRNRIMFDTWVEGEGGVKVIDGKACVVATSNVQRNRLIANGLLDALTDARTRSDDNLFS